MTRKQISTTLKTLRPDHDPTCATSPMLAGRMDQWRWTCSRFADELADDREDYRRFMRDCNAL